VYVAVPIGALEKMKSQATILDFTLAAIYLLVGAIISSPSHGLLLLICEVSLIVFVSLWPVTWFTEAPVLFGPSRSIEKAAARKALEAPVAEEEPLTNDELEAIAAAKRIVAKARAQFLAENNGSVPMASLPAQKLASQGADIFTKNLNPDISAENKKWVSNYKDDAREVEIFSADFPGHPCKRWKVVATLRCDLETAYDAMFVPENRRVWDALVKDLKILQINDCPPEVGDGLAITSIVTNQVVVVSSRSMLDIALQRCLKRGGITLVNVSIPSEYEETKLDPRAEGTVRATTHIGSGALIEPIKGRPGCLRYVLVSTIELGGWLPPGVINATMTTSLAQSTAQMQDFLIEKVKARGA